MAIKIKLKLNNQEIDDYKNVIRIYNPFPTFQWEFDLTGKVTIDESTGIVTGSEDFAQLGYDIRIAEYNFNIGTNSFLGNIVNTGLIDGQELFWRYSGENIERGISYFGQIRSKDELGRYTEWKTFLFMYNSLPSVSNVLISPSSPSVTDSLSLNYDFYDADGDLEEGTIIRWFKNGSHQRQFDGSLTILSSFLQNNDIWNVDVYPSDGYEYGSRVTSSHVKISSIAITIDDYHILPKNPNPNDILKADYIVSDSFEQENVLIRWYKNDLLLHEYNDQKYIKPVLEEGDVVRFEIKHKDGLFYYSSESISVVSSNFIVSNILIDGKINPLDVSSITPVVKWRSNIPINKEINFVSIKIGTFYESDNIYSVIFDYERDSFTIPSNLLQIGMDYYISISISDIESFDNYTVSHFRVRGSRWEDSVSNSTGWTFETLFKTSADLDLYQIIRINDGSRFAEIRLYSDKIKLISGSQVEYKLDFTKVRFLTVLGKNDDIKIYINREIVINGEGIYTQVSNIKKLELGSYNSLEFEVFYKYFFYTVSGCFYPGISEEYSNIQFHKYMEFEDNEIVALQGYINGKYIFGTNPDNVNESSTIYAIKAGESLNFNTVPRTFSPINKIKKSPDDKLIVCSHSGGTTIISGYYINPFNYEIIFKDENGVLNETYPDQNGWELVSNTDFNSSYFDSDGLNIDTIG